MTRHALLTGIICCAVFIGPAETQASPAEAQSGDDTVGAGLIAAIKDLAAEVRGMRLELLELRREALKQTILALEQQLNEIEQEQRRRSEEDRSYQSQIGELNQTIAVHRGDQDERDRLEAIRASLVETNFRDVRPALGYLAQRQSELSRQLRVEKEKLQALSPKAQKQ